jgi:hypothetical protein
MRARTPAHPGCTWFSVPGSWFSVRDARAPRGHVVLGSRFLVLGSWFLVPGSWFLVLGSRFGTPAHPGTLSAVAPQGLPRAQRGLQPAVSACGRDARAPRGHVVLGSWFLVLGSRFSVPGSWFSVRDARAPRDTLRRSPAGASTCSARASARSLRLLPHPFATCSRRNCANTIRPVCV